MATRVCVIQYDDRTDETLGNQLNLTRVNRRMCDADRASYRFHRSSSHHLPPYWQKVQLVSDALNSGECDEVLYLDTDAVLRYPPSTVVAELKDKSFLMSGDMPPWKASFNAGVWAVRNDDAGTKIMKDWMDMYNPSAWTATSQGWRCQTKKCTIGGCRDVDCKWAGSEYEQGSMLPVIKANERGFKRLQWDRLQHHCNTQTDPATLTCHFASHYKEGIDAYLRRETA